MSEPASRRRFLGMGLGVLGAAGFLGAGAAAAPGGGEDHDLLSATHPDTVTADPVRGDLVVANSTPAWARKARGSTGQLLSTDGSGDLAWTTDTHNVLSTRHGDAAAGSVARGDLLVGNATPKVSRLALGATGWQPRSLGGDVVWSYPGMIVDNLTVQDLALTATGDNQAGMLIGDPSFTLWIPQLMIEIAGPANNTITLEGAIHDPAHTILETFRFNYPPTGAGDIFRSTSTIWGFRTAGFPGGGSFHLNITAIALNGGTATVKVRLLWGGN